MKYKYKIKSRKSDLGILEIKQQELQMKNKTKKYLINCYNQRTHERELFSTDESVYVYVRQLENKIKYPTKSKLFNLYPELDKTITGVTK